METSQHIPNRESGKRHHNSSEHRKRSRSRSPHRHEHDNSSSAKRRRRSHSPHRKSHLRHQPHDHRVTLPFSRDAIHASSLEPFRALFAEYLSLQKQLSIDDLTSHETKGRFKSFVGKWNRRELAEGWYDPGLQQRAEERFAAGETVAIPLRQESRGASGTIDSSTGKRNERVHEHGVANEGAEGVDEDEDEDEDDGYGPAVAQNQRAPMAGAAIPSVQDLQHRREMVDEEREIRMADAKYVRKQDRILQKERLEDLAPRADPGSRERQLEKKRETAITNRAFADAKVGGGQEEVEDADLMGANGAESFKAKVKARERQKNGREIRKEELLRARTAEREERMAEYRAKEEKTMERFKAIAKQRFG